MTAVPDSVSRFLGALTPFDAEHDDLLVCRQVRQETHDVRTFTFTAFQPRRFDYFPGQFLTFEFEIAGELVHRCYTIASAPTRPGMVSITVKRVPGGPASNWLHDEMKPGMSVKAVGPMGTFTCLTQPASKYLFLSGGSGITPLMSMARTFHDLSEPRDVVFVHAARTPADIIFRRELDLIAQNMPSFRFAPICEADAPGERWHGLTGRLSLDIVKHVAPDFMDRTVFTCGPSPFMAAAKSILSGAGHDAKRYFEESFSFDELPSALAEEVLEVEAAIGTRTYSIQFAKTGKTIDCPEDTPILTAAKAAGMRLPSSCTKGMCGTCKSKKLSGDVEMTHQGGIRQREIDAGMVLICCAKPRSDVVIER